MDRKQRTLELQRSGGLNCSQAIITCFGQEFGISTEAAKRTGRPWGGGIGHLGETCGYLTGAVHILAHAFDHPDENMARADVYRAVQALFRQFAAKRGTAKCRDLLGADLGTEAGLQKAKSEGLVKKICCSPDGIGGDVAEILESILTINEPPAS
jgi:C_GCAxxG_C_C family probable redox protein